MPCERVGGWSTWPDAGNGATFRKDVSHFSPSPIHPPPSFYHDRHDPHRRFLLIYAVKQVNVVSIQLPHGRDGAENGNAGRGQSVDSSAELKGVMMNINDGGKWGGRAAD